MQRTVKVNQAPALHHRSSSRWMKPEWGRKRLPEEQTIPGSFLLIESMISPWQPAGGAPWREYLTWRRRLPHAALSKTSHTLCHRDCLGTSHQNSFCCISYFLDGSSRKRSSRQMWWEKEGRTDTGRGWRRKTFGTWSTWGGDRVRPREH